MKKHHCQKDTSHFICRSKRIHGERYDYSQSKYIIANSPLEIICREHGKFLMKPKNHYSGQGCKRCPRTTRLTTEQFIEKAKRVHGDTYDYSECIYVRQPEPVKIICRIHGLYLQFPNNHLSGGGCLNCARRRNPFAFKPIVINKRLKRVQGYEPQAISLLKNKYGVKEDQIVVGKDVPIIKYTDPENEGKKKRLHFPDIYIKNENHLVEVKSPFTFLIGFRELKRKRAGAINQGFKYTVLVMRSDGTPYNLPKLWHLFSKDSIKKRLFSENR